MRGARARGEALYTKLGFDVREPLVSIQGQTLGLEIPGYQVRLATADDLAACNRLCQTIHDFVGEASGHENRSRELTIAIDRGTATVFNSVLKIGLTYKDLSSL